MGGSERGEGKRNKKDTKDSSPKEKSGRDRTSRRQRRDDASSSRTSSRTRGSSRGREKSKSRRLRREASPFDEEGGSKSNLRSKVSSATSISSRASSAVSKSSRTHAAKKKNRQVRVPIPKAYDIHEDAGYINQIKHMIAAETKNVYERFFGKHRLYGSHDDIYRGGNNKKQAICIVATMLILVLIGLVITMVVLQEGDGVNTTDPSTTILTTSVTSKGTTRCPYTPGTDPTETGHYCRDCDAGSDCNTCCRRYFSRPTIRNKCIAACKSR